MPEHNNALAKPTYLRKAEAGIRAVECWIMPLMAWNRLQSGVIKSADPEITGKAYKHANAKTGLLTSGFSSLSLISRDWYDSLLPVSTRVQGSSWLSCGDPQTILLCILSAIGLKDLNMDLRWPARAVCSEAGSYNTSPLHELWLQLTTEPMQEAHRITPPWQLCQQ